MKLSFLALSLALMPLIGNAGDAVAVDILGGDAILMGDTEIRVELRDGSEIASRKKFAPPIRITDQIETDGDVRFGYGADQIILNWGRDEKELRIDGGPANKQHVKGGGFTPRNETVTVTQTVLPNRMTIAVNGVERAAWTADFSRVREQIRIFPHRATVVVSKILVEPIDVKGEVKQ